MAGKKQKRCTKCGLPKPLEDFGTNARRTDGRQSWCKKCARDYVRARRAKPGGMETERKRARARQTALEELARRHPVEFAALLTQERVVVGLSPIRWDRQRGVAAVRGRSAAR